MSAGIGGAARWQSWLSRTYKIQAPCTLFHLCWHHRNKRTTNTFVQTKARLTYYAILLKKNLNKWRYLPFMGQTSYTITTLTEFQLLAETDNLMNLKLLCKCKTPRIYKTISGGSSNIPTIVFPGERSLTTMPLSHSAWSLSQPWRRYNTIHLCSLWMPRPTSTRSNRLWRNSMAPMWPKSIP